MSMTIQEDWLELVTPGGKPTGRRWGWDFNADDNSPESYYEALRQAVAAADAEGEYAQVWLFEFGRLKSVEYESILNAIAAAKAKREGTC